MQTKSGSRWRGENGSIAAGELRENGKGGGSYPQISQITQRRQGRLETTGLRLECREGNALTSSLKPQAKPQASSLGSQVLGLRSPLAITVRLVQFGRHFISARNTSFERLAIRGYVKIASMRVVGLEDQQRLAVEPPRGPAVWIADTSVGKFQPETASGCRPDR